MIELAPDLMEALQAAAERKGRTVSEVANEVIREWHEPSPWWPDDDEALEPQEPPRQVVLPIEGATYTSEAGPLRVKAVKPMWEPAQPIYEITIEFLSEQDGEEWEEHQIYGETWMALLEEFGMTLDGQAA